MKRVIVTGATGVVGIALIQELVKHDILVTVVSRPNSERIKNIPMSSQVEVVECDLKELQKLSQLLTEKYDTFYHFAWNGTFGNARNDMQGQLKNIQYTLDAVELAAVLGCKTFIGAGSQAEYGRFEGKLNQTVPVFPENGYGIAKLCAGQMSRILCEQKGIKHIWTRILSVYGPYDGQDTMIMSAIRQLLCDEIPSFTKGEQEWDYLYSKDAGYAMYLLGEKGQSGKVYCIGSGKTRRISEYVECLRNTINPKLLLGLGDKSYDSKQVMYLCADISELTKDTGFIPKYEFEIGIKETIEWYKGRYVK